MEAEVGGVRAGDGDGAGFAFGDNGDVGRGGEDAGFGQAEIEAAEAGGHGVFIAPAGEFDAAGGGEHGEGRALDRGFDPEGFAEGLGGGGEAVENEDFGVGVGFVLFGGSVGGGEPAVGVEEGAKEGGFAGVDHDADQLLFGQFEGGAVVFGDGVAEDEAGFEVAGGLGAEFDASGLFGAGGEGEAGRADRGAAEGDGEGGVFDLAGVVFNGHEDLPELGVGRGAAEGDLADTDVAEVALDGEEAEVGGEFGFGGQVVGVGAEGADEDDVAEAAAVLALHLAGEIERGAEVEGRGAGAGFEDRLFGGRAVGGEDGGGGGEGVGADEHDAVGGGEAAEPEDGVAFGLVEEGAGAGAGTHPGGAVEDEDVVAAHAVW